MITDVIFPAEHAVKSIRLIYVEPMRVILITSLMIKQKFTGLNLT